MIPYPEVGHVEVGTVIEVHPTYAILLYEDGWTGLLHISEASRNYIHDFESYIPVGTIYPTKIIEIEKYSRNIHVSMVATTPADKRKVFKHQPIAKREVDFTPLKLNLPAWIEAAKKEENIHD